MLGSLVDPCWQGAVDGTPIRDIVGADPVEFAEESVADSADGQWIHQERARLFEPVGRAAGTSD